MVTTMALTTKLSKRSVDAALPKAERYVIWDVELKGFGLRVETSGSKSRPFWSHDVDPNHSAAA